MAAELALFLNRLHDRYHRAEYLSSDPLEFVHRYSDPWDQECVALVGALLAYGNVKQIRRSVEDLLARLERAAIGWEGRRGPAAAVRALSGAQGRVALDRELRGFVHRMNTAADLSVFLRLLSKSWRLHGSLGGHFVGYLESSAPTFESALDRVMDDWKSWAREEWAPGTVPRSFLHLLASPRAGSVCKRWCMFLRWMGRRDALDPGLWVPGGPMAQAAKAAGAGWGAGRGLRCDQLVLPVDTHTGRISRYLGLTRRQTLGWAAALEITEGLRRSDPNDPTRYDFALARLGILDLCQSRYRADVCEMCELVTVCKFAAKGRAKRATASRRLGRPSRARS